MVCISLITIAFAKYGIISDIYKYFTKKINYSFINHKTKHAYVASVNKT